VTSSVIKIPALAHATCVNFFPKYTGWAMSSSQTDKLFQTIWAEHVGSLSCKLTHLQVTLDAISVMMVVNRCLSPPFKGICECRKHGKRYNSVMNSKLCRQVTFELSHRRKKQTNNKAQSRSSHGEPQQLHNTERSGNFISS
jgi:hypothetical protein